MKHYKLLAFTLILSLFFAGGLTAIAQDAAASPAAADASASASPGADSKAADAKGESMIQVVIKGGFLTISIWVAILGTSITMVTFVIQNFITLRKERLAPSALVNTLQELINNRQYQQAWEACDAVENYLANVLQAGLTRIGRGKEAVEDAIAEHSLREAQVIRTRNSYLSVIGVISPMIGLLGTVIGMMKAFRTLGSSGLSDPRGLATSIGEVLTATASGLFIAIPAFIFYYIFRNRSQMVIVHADDMVNQLIMDIPFEQLEGLNVGANPSAVTPQRFIPAGGPAPIGARDPRSLSSNLQTTKCPVCGGLIVAGQNPCSHCGSTLEWAQ